MYNLAETLTANGFFVNVNMTHIKIYDSWSNRFGVAAKR